MKNMAYNETPSLFLPLYRKETVMFSDTYIPSKSAEIAKFASRIGIAAVVHAGVSKVVDAVFKEELETMETKDVVMIRVASFGLTSAATEAIAEQTDVAIEAVDARTQARQAKKLTQEAEEAETPTEDK